MSCPRSREVKLPIRKYTASKLIFIPIPKKANAKECSNYHTIMLISHASGVMLKVLQARFQQYMNNFQM